MEQVAIPEVQFLGERPLAKVPLAFLDSNVILNYIHGDPSAISLFSAESNGLIRFAVNPIVLQELLLASDAAGQQAFEHLQDHLRILPVDFNKAEALLPRARSLRNRFAHANDILILSSAAECDFLVTTNPLFKSLATDNRLQVVTPEELALQL